MKQDTNSSRVVALVADLIFASRVRGAAPPGVTVATATSVARAKEALGEASARLLLVDLSVAGAAELVAWVRETGVADGPIVAFGSHVDADALAVARSAGADRVLARSAFVKELGGLLGETVGEG